MRKKSIVRLGYVIPVILLVMLLSTINTNADEVTVCNVGNTAYTCIEDAVTAIMDGTGQGTIVLTNDCQVNAPIVVKATKQNSKVEIALDLAGHVVTNTCDPIRTQSGVFSIEDNATLQLLDSQGKGMLYSEKLIDKYIYIAGGTFLMEGGSIQIASPEAIDVQAIVESAAIYLSSGQYIGNAGTVRAVNPFLTDGLVKSEGDTELTINGGTYEAYLYSGIGAYVTAHLNGGTFNHVWVREEISSDVIPSIVIAVVEDSKNDIYINGGAYHGGNTGFVYQMIMSANYDTEAGQKQLLSNHSRITLQKNQKLYTTSNQQVTFTLRRTLAGTGFYGYIFVSDDNVYVDWAKSYAAFQPCGGKVSKSKALVTYSRTYGALPTPTRAGYTFLGWYTSATKGSKVTSATKVTKTSNHSLYAHWKPVTAKISFQGNGGKGLSKSSSTATYDKKLGTLPTIHRKNYSFLGWYTKKSGGSKVTSKTVSKMTKATTLYAHWSKVSVSKGDIKSLYSKSYKLTITCSKVSGAKGYQIILARNSKFTKGIKKMYVTSPKKTITKLRKGTTYYVKIRAYKIDSTNSKVFGALSKGKKMKIK